MGRAVSNVLVWGAAGGLFLAAILPAASDPAESDQRRSAASSPHEADREMPAAVSGGAVCAAAVEHPDLMHRKHQEDGPGDRVHLRAAASNAAVGEIAIAAALLCGRSEPLGGPDVRGRNTPLRL